MELHEKLIDLRKEKGLSQVEVAEELNVTRQSISRWETGASVPSTDNLICLSRLFGVPLENLIGGENGAVTESGCPDETEESAVTDSGERKRSRTAARAILYICALLLVAAVSVYIGITWGAKEEKDTIPVEELTPKDIILDGTFSIEPLK